jgi:hypothetical protein
MKTFFLILGLVVVLAAAAVFGYSWSKPVATASPVASASPTATPDNMIVIDQPKEGSQISSPLKVTGKARGNWYFEASFPVILTDWDGKIIAQVPAQAKGDWMTTDWVPFEATLTFTDPGAVVSSRCFLILKKDNPSGLPANDDSREITVFFK